MNKQYFLISFQFNKNKMMELYHRNEIIKSKDYDIKKYKYNILWNKEYTKAHDQHFFEQKKIQLTVSLKIKIRKE